MVNEKVEAAEEAAPDAGPVAVAAGAETTQEQVGEAKYCTILYYTVLYCTIL
jgi:hypothetical protein